MAFPFEQIGIALRKLSLSGSSGNITAIILYSLICLIPCVVLIFRKRRRFYPEDILVILLSLSLFFVLYQMINPDAIVIAGGYKEGISAAKTILGGMVYSIIMGYFILRVLRLFYASDAQKVQRYLSVLLFLLNIMFAAAIIGGGVNKVIESVRTMQISNSGSEYLFGINFIFICLGFLAENLPYACNIWIVFLARQLLKNLMLGRYGEAAIVSAKKLSRTCGAALLITVITNIAYQMLQLCFAAQLFTINTSIQIPLFSVVFVLVCLLFTKLAEDNKALREENDSII